VPNRLAEEHSPYLLQHKDNPVEWYPWGEEAFARARLEDKPIFLSIGYSTCHWCHVMEHESFEHHEVADVLNRQFISIKVDREERPDVDRVYMTFVQATTGSGGWPMSVWLTPQLEPFYGGTYFPPTTRWGRPGFVEVLQEIARVWRDERDKVLQSASRIVERMRSLRPAGGSGEVPGTDALDQATREFAAAFDARRGGFGDAPKFPRPSELLFLMREYARTGAKEPRDMALLTLKAMAFGGMRDHIGGGFHRYSVDGDWRVPHFEKMLYDQAQLSLAYLEAAQITGERFYADVAADTLDYVRRDLTDAGGGFYSAEDADSLPPDPGATHKIEGAFYVWSDDDIGDALGADAQVFRLRYGVRPGGNAPADPQGEFVGKNLLYTAQTIEEVALASSRTPDDVVAALDRARATLMNLRNRRPRPHLDDKVLTAWNGLMIGAFARAGRLSSVYVAAARRAATFIRKRLWNGVTLLRRYRNGDAAVEGYAEDYAYLIFGLLELFQADGDPAWLEWAVTLQQRQDELFWDAEGGGWFSTTGRDPSVLLRLKEDYDGAEPAASSISVLNLLTLAHLMEAADPQTPKRSHEPTPSSQELGVEKLGVGSYHDRIERTLGIFAARAGQFGRAVPMMLAALSTYHQGMPQLVIVGEPAAADTQALVAEARRRYHPTTIIVPAAPAHQDRLATLLPWIGSMGTKDGQATAFLCRNFACSAPVATPTELAVQLNEGGA
jgi:uncharacterized protein